MFKSMSGKGAFYIRRKHAYMVLRYWLRSFARRIPGRIGLSLMLLSICISTVAMFPSILHRTQSLDISGTVSIKIYHKGKPIMTTFAPGAAVEIGGYKTNTDASGVFVMSFRSATLVEIPVIIAIDKVETISRISYAPGEFTIHKDFLLQ